MGGNSTNGSSVMDVSKNRGIQTPQNGWFIMENPIKVDDLEVDNNNNDDYNYNNI